MNQTLSLQQLADRLVRVEREMNIIREELADLRQQTRAVPQAAVTQFAIAYSWADKEILRHWIKGLFAACLSRACRWVPNCSSKGWGRLVSPPMN